MGFVGGVDQVYVPKRFNLTILKICIIKDQFLKLNRPVVALFFQNKI